MRETSAPFMLSMDDVLSPSRKTLREFAAISLVIFGALALWQGLLRQNVHWGIVFAALSLGIGITGLIRPAFVKPIFVGWMLAAFPIAWIVSNLFLSALYFGLFLPIACFLRLLGRDALQLKLDPEKATYWEAFNAAPSAGRYFRQY